MKDMMALLHKLLGWEDWMKHWVVYDVLTDEYVGYCPDEDELYRHAEPATFLLGWKEARGDWSKQQ